MDATVPLGRYWIAPHFFGFQLSSANVAKCQVRSVSGVMPQSLSVPSGLSGHTGASPRARTTSFAVDLVVHPRLPDE